MRFSLVRVATFSALMQADKEAILPGTAPEKVRVHVSLEIPRISSDPFVSKNVAETKQENPAKPCQELE